MERIIHKNMLRQLTVISFPHISDKKERRKIHKDLHRIAFPSSFKKNVVTNDNLKLA